MSLTDAELLVLARKHEKMLVNMPSDCRKWTELIVTGVSDEQPAKLLLAHTALAIWGFLHQIDVPTEEFTWAKNVLCGHGTRT